MRNGAPPHPFLGSPGSRAEFGAIRGNAQAQRVQRSQKDQTSSPSAELEYPTDGSLPNATDDNYLIKGILTRKGVGSIVGAPGSAKTTWVLDVLFAVANGVEIYQGRRVRRAPGLYVGYEGEAGIKNRISAAYRKHGNKDDYFARLLLPESLSRGPDGDKGEAQIIAAARLQQDATGSPVGIIAIDTKSRATAGDNEDNNGEAALFLQRVQRIATATDACIMICHHPGKDPARGPRGASANQGGDDFTLIINRERGSSTRTLYLDKIRDGRDKTDWFSFDLETIELRLDSDGEPVTAPVIKPLATARVPKKPAHPIPPQARMALDALNRLYEGHHAKRVEPHMLNDVDVPRCLLMAEWREACRQKRLTTTDDADLNAVKQAEDKAFQRARDTLERSGHIGSYDRHVWLIGQMGRTRT